MGSSLSAYGADSSHQPSRGILNRGDPNQSAPKWPPVYTQPSTQSSNAQPFNTQPSTIQPSPFKLPSLPSKPIKPLPPQPLHSFKQPPPPPPIKSSDTFESVKPESQIHHSQQSQPYYPETNPPQTHNPEISSSQPYHPQSPQLLSFDIQSSDDPTPIDLIPSDFIKPTPAEDPTLTSLLSSVGITPAHYQRFSINPDTLNRLWEVEGHPIRNTLRWMSIDHALERGLYALFLKRQHVGGKAPPISPSSILSNSSIPSNSFNSSTSISLPSLSSSSVSLSFPPQEDQNPKVDPMGGSASLPPSSFLTLEDPQAPSSIPTTTPTILSSNSDPSSSPSSPVSSLSPSSSLTISARSLPLKDPEGLRRSVAINALKQGLEEGLFEGLHVTFFGILGYQLSQLGQSGAVSATALYDIYHGSKHNGVLGLTSLIHDNPSLFAFFGVPAGYGMAKALWNTCRLNDPTPTYITSLVSKGHALETEDGTWSNYGRWIFPFHPMSRFLSSAQKALLWEGRITADDREKIFTQIQALAPTSHGYSQMNVLHSLARLAYGIHLNDYPTLSDSMAPDELAQLLSIKTRSLQSLNDLHGSLSSVNALYTDYLLWGLGQPRNKPMAAFMTAYKGAKLATQALLFKMIAETIMDYLSCPKKQGFTWSGGYQSWASDYTETCFNEVVRQFNVFPGQPPKTLTDVIPTYYFPTKTYQLDLSGKGIEDDSILEILQGFITQHAKGQGPALTSINLSNNQIGSKGDNTTASLARILRSIPSLTSLDLGNNQIGLYGSAGVQALADSLQTLSNLQSFTLLPSLILSAKQLSLFQGTPFDMTNSPTLLPKPNRLTDVDSVRAFFQTANLGIQNFSLSNRVTDDSSGQVMTALMKGLKDYAVTDLDLSHNYIGINGDQGVMALGNGLPTLPMLRSVDLDTNGIGYSGEEGATMVMRALSSLSNLVMVGLENNWLGRTGNSSIVALKQTLGALEGLQSFTLLPSSYPLSAASLTFLNQEGIMRNVNLPLLSFPLIDVPTVDLYFQAVRPGTTRFDFSGMVSDDAAGLVLTALMRRVSLYNATLTSLDLGSNWIGSFSDTGTQAIGKSLGKLTALTSLDLGSNWIGWYSDTGTQIIGQSLGNLTALTSLDLSGNYYIGYRGDTGIQAIGKSLSKLTALTSLNLGSNSIGWQGIQGVQAIARSLNGSLPSLKTFIITSCRTPLSSQMIVVLNSGLSTHPNLPLFPFMLSDPQAVALYFQSVPPLTTSFNFNGLVTDDAAGLVLTALMKRVSLYNATLTFLNLGGNQIGWASDTGTQAIGQSLGNLKSLTSLDLGSNWIGRNGDADTQAIGQSFGNLKSLTSLDLSKNYIGYLSDTGTQIIGQSLGKLTALTSLNLGGNEIGARGTQGTSALLQSLPTLTHLISFTISPNQYIPASTIVALNFAASYHPIIPVSSIYFTSPLAVQTYCATIPPSTSSFSFARNLTDDASGSTLTALMSCLTQYNVSLTSLDLSHNQIGFFGDRGTRAIGQALTTFHSLTSLDLSYNTIGSSSDNGTILIGQSLTKLPSLISLNLGYNQMGSLGPVGQSLGSSAIVSAIPSLVNLKDLTLNGLQNIQWDQNLVQINSFSSRNLKAVCASELCFGTSVGSGTTNINTTRLLSDLFVGDPFMGDDHLRGMSMIDRSQDAEWFDDQPSGSTQSTKPQTSAATRRAEPFWMITAPFEWGLHLGQTGVMYIQKTLGQPLYQGLSYGASYLNQRLDEALASMGQSALDTAIQCPSYFPNVMNPHVYDWGGDRGEDERGLDGGLGVGVGVNFKAVSSFPVGVVQMSRVSAVYGDLMGE